MLLLVERRRKRQRFVPDSGAACVAQLRVQGEMDLRRGDNWVYDIQPWLWSFFD